MICPCCNREALGSKLTCKSCGSMLFAVASSGGGGSIKGLEPNLGGFFCYLGFFVTGLIFFILEKENRFIRFHALQSLVTFGGIAVLLMVLRLFFAGGRPVELIITLMLLCSMLLWVFLMLKAYQGEEFELPLLGEWAKDLVS